MVSIRRSLRRVSLCTDWQGQWWTALTDTVPRLHKIEKKEKEKKKLEEKKAYIQLEK